MLTYGEAAPGVHGLVWDMGSTRGRNISSTVFFSPATPGRRSKSAFLFHHGHSDCICPVPSGTPAGSAARRRCRPGCRPDTPQLAERADKGYTWWDQYNVSKFFHSLGSLPGVAEARRPRADWLQ